MRRAILPAVIGATVVMSIGAQLYKASTNPMQADPVSTLPVVKVEVTNLPNPQNVSGLVDVGNLPEVQSISGTVQVGNLPLDAQGSITVSGTTRVVELVPGVTLSSGSEYDSEAFPTGDAQVVGIRVISTSSTCLRSKLQSRWLPEQSFADPVDVGESVGGAPAFYAVQGIEGRIHVRHVGGCGDVTVLSISAFIRR